jgi:hypothetical protein
MGKATCYGPLTRVRLTFIENSQMPDDIKTHARALLTPYAASVKSVAKIQSARALVRLALINADLYPSHRRKIISDAIWYVTEADGKWKTRFKSKQVLYLAKNEPGSLVRINHEHVFTRKALVDEILRRGNELLGDPSQLDDLLGTAVGCIVTKFEHDSLAPGFGWARYAGKVEVYDTAEIPPRMFEFPLSLDS